MSGTYRYASVVRLTMDDPTNDIGEGDVFIVAGQCEDGVFHTVLDDETKGFVDVECEVIDTFHADYRMSKSEIKAWAGDLDEAKQAAKNAMQEAV